MFDNWHRGLENRFKKADEDGDLSGLYSLICQVELGLFSLEVLNLEDPDILWVLLTGYNFPEYDAFSSDQKRALANARIYLNFGSASWREHLAQYMGLPARWRMFKVEDGKFVRETGMTRVTDREEAYQAALQKRPKLRKQSRTLPELEIPVHFTHAGSGNEISLKLDKDLVEIAKEVDKNLCRMPDTPVLEREAIRIPFSALRAYANELNQRFGLPFTSIQEEKDGIGFGKCDEHSLGNVASDVLGDSPGSEIDPLSQHASPYARDWVKAINETIRFRAVSKSNDGKLLLGEVNEGDLVVEGVVHVAGIVGSGKSTLAELLAMYGVEKGGFRTTLVVGDTQTALDLANRINLALGAGLEQPVAVPLIGKTTRGEHYRKLRTSTGANLNQWGNAWLNPTCLLQGLIPLEAIEEPLPQGSEPCERLEQKRKETNTLTTICECPFFSLCPSRVLDRQAPGARIWVTTPQAMTLSRMPVQMDQRRFRYAELIYFYSDLVIFDEIDADQQVLDDTYAPERHLIKERSGDLGEADRYSSGWFGLSPKNPTYIRRRRALTYAGIAADHLSNLLENGKNQFLREWTDRLGYFSPSILFRSISDELQKIVDQAVEPGSSSKMGSSSTILRENGEVVSTPNGRAGIDGFIDNIFMQELWKFQDCDKVMLPRAETPEMQLLTDVLQRAFFGSYDNHGPQKDSQAWIVKMLKRSVPLGKEVKVKVPDEKLSELGLKLEFAVVLSALENYLYALSHGYPEDDDDETTPPDFRNLSYVPGEFLSAIPTSPLGAVSGFRYTNDDPKGNGATPGRKNRHLLYFRFAAPGRYFLLNLGHLFTNSGYPGPNILCMSGTSRMEDSDTHHFAIEPSGVLEAPEEAQEAIRKSEFRYYPQRDINGNPIRISGSGNLEAELAKLAIALSSSPQVSQSLLALVMNRLGELGNQDLAWADRQRILVLVNSYKQTKLVAQIISNQVRFEKPDWEIYYLERASRQGDDDSEGQWSGAGHGAKSLYRPELTNLGGMTSNPTILVAPLLAVGRRHNILNQEKTAAFGAIFFATRPMKTPDDLSRWVYWINYQTIKLLQDPINKVWEGCQSPKDRLLRLRRIMNGWWSRIGSYKDAASMNDRRLRRSLAATMAATIIQATGRLLRGGVPFLAYFVDAAWAPRSANQLPDAKKESLLIETIDIVNEYCQNTIGNALFGPLNDALQRIEGVVRKQPASRSQIDMPDVVNELLDSEAEVNNEDYFEDA